MSKRLRLGLLSTARINDMIIAGASGSDRVEIVAVASRDASRARVYADEHSIDRSHGSYEELLADPELDAVYISLPNGLHHEWTMAALKAGKHVLCEKPYSRRPAEVQAAFAAAREAGCVVMEAIMYDYHPQIAEALDLVGNGAIGRLRAIQAAFTTPLVVRGEPNIRLAPALDGGAVMDVACYCISGCRRFGGEPESVSAELVTGPSGVEIAAHATLRFPDDVIGQIEASFVAPLRQRLELVGESGALVLQSPWIHSQWEHRFGEAVLSPMLLRRDGLAPESFELSRLDAYRAELEHLADVAAGRSEQLIGEADALGQARTIDAIYRAAAERSTVTVLSGPMVAAPAPD